MKEQRPEEAKLRIAGPGRREIGLTAAYEHQGWYTT
jgi:hypothetical protein